MTFETTLTCDGCSGIIDSGSRVEVAETLEREHGRAFVVARKGGFKELGPNEDWTRAKRHLGACCADATEFFDGRLVPTKGEEGR